MAPYLSKVHFISHPNLGKLVWDQLDLLLDASNKHHWIVHTLWLLNWQMSWWWNITEFIPLERGSVDWRDNGIHKMDHTAITSAKSITFCSLDLSALIHFHVHNLMSSLLPHASLHPFWLLPLLYLHIFSRFPLHSGVRLFCQQRRVLLDLAFLALFEMSFHVVNLPALLYPLTVQCHTNTFSRPLPLTFPLLSWSPYLWLHLQLLPLLLMVIHFSNIQIFVLPSSFLHLKFHF